MQSPNRRQLLRDAAAYSALLAGWNLARADGKAAEPFKFIVVNDLHLFDKGCAPWFSKTFAQMRTHEPEICFVVGDFGEDGKADQIGLMKELLAELKMPIHVVIGNHDYDANDKRSNFEKAFPNSINYLLDHRGWQVVALDSTQGRAGKDTRIGKDTMDFAVAAAKEIDKKKPTLIVTHFPLGFFMPSRPANANDLLAIFAEHNIQGVFNGHFHSAQTRAWHGTEIVTNRCCSFRKKNHDFDPRKGYFVCTAKDGEIKREYVDAPKIEA